MNMNLLSQSPDCECVWEISPNHRIHSPCGLTMRCESESVASRVVSEQQEAWEYHAIACLGKARLARADIANLDIPSDDITRWIKMQEIILDCFDRFLQSGETEDALNGYLIARALVDSEIAYPEYEPLRHQLEATLHSIDKDEWEMHKNSLLKQYGLL